MYSDQQFEQLMLQYNQIKNSSEEVAHLIEIENFDSAITMIKQRDPILLNCKCIRKYLDLTPDQEIELNKILEEIRTLEDKNIKNLKNAMIQLKQELDAEKKNSKIQNAYNNMNELNSTFDLKEE